jgi:ABC-2 type transport system permease protein
MNNIRIITTREYLTRVKKKSFILMTLLTPLLITAFYGIIIWVSIGQSNSSEKQNIVVVDNSGYFKEELKSTDNISFIKELSYSNEELIAADSVDAYVSIPKSFDIDQPLKLAYNTMGSLSVSNNEKIKNAFKSVMREKKLTNLGVQQTDIDKLNNNVSIESVTVEKDGTTKKSNLGMNTGVGMALAMMIYFFIFLYGVQVMKGVIEEKTNRIVELIVSTVKPFQLMMGKVIGIALVGLTQLTIWVTLTGILMTVIGVILGLSMGDISEAQNLANNPQMANMDSTMAEALEAFYNLPLLKIFFVFLFFFLGGYLFYGALFAAIGSAVDNETDTQQFMLPITMPLVFSIAISFSIIAGDPNGTLATWMSMIPLTSPIVMMVRLPFMTSADNWEIFLSMGIMIASIIGVIWVAGKIYRTGILMYGKKPTYKELAKWLFYKN